MKDDEARLMMVKRVKAAFKKYPRFKDLPEVKQDAGLMSSAIPDIEKHEERHYVSALHAVCANGEVIGRCGNEVIGKFVNIGTTALQQAIAPTLGRKLKAQSG